MFFVVQEWDLQSQQSTHKNCVPEFQILSTLKLRSCGMVIFLNMNNYMLTEDRFQNILERKLSNWFGQLILIY